MEITLIRHTEPQVALGICYGQTDLVLSEIGKEHAQQLAKELKQFDQIYSSPLQRCTFLANEIGGEPILDDRLMEMNFGAWEMKSWDELDQNQLHAWMFDFENQSVADGESAKDVKIRILSFLEDVKIQNLNSIGIICHAGVIRTFISIIENMTLTEAFNVKIEYGQRLTLNF